MRMIISLKTCCSTLYRFKQYICAYPEYPLLKKAEAVDALCSSLCRLI